MEKRSQEKLTTLSKSIRCGDYKLDTNTFVETLPNGVATFGFVQ